jgi:fucose permease
MQESLGGLILSIYLFSYTLGITYYSNYMINKINKEYTVVIGCIISIIGGTIVGPAEIIASECSYFMSILGLILVGLGCAFIYW